MVSRKQERCFARLHSLSRVIRPLPWERVALSRRLPIFQISGRERAPVEKQPCTRRAEYVYPPSSLPTARLDECPWTRQFRSPSFAFFFSFSSLPIGSLLGRSCFASPLHLRADIDSIIYITEIVLRNEISKSFVLL